MYMMPVPSFEITINDSPPINTSSHINYLGGGPLLKHPLLHLTMLSTRLGYSPQGHKIVHYPACDNNNFYHVKCHPKHYSSYTSTQLS